MTITSAASSEMDPLDQLGAKALDGFLVRKDLVRQCSRQYPVPTDVVEFLLGRNVRTGEEELFKARARDQGSVKLIYLVRSRLDTRSDSYVAEVPGLAIKDAHIDDAIDGDPLPPGQVWAISPGSGETGPSLYRIEIAVGPGSGVKILNQPVPPAFRESTKVGEQNVYACAKSLVGDRDPRGHEFSIQLRAMDNDRSGAGLGLPVMVALVGGLLDRNTRGSTIIVGSLNLGGSIEMIPNAIAIAELAVEKQAKVLLMPVSARRGLNDLPDDLWTKISIEYYKDPEDAAFKGLEE